MELKIKKGLDLPIVGAVPPEAVNEPQPVASPVVAMAYVPFQLDKTTYSPEVALCEGTLFKVLNKPFCGRSLMNE